MAPEFSVPTPTYGMGPLLFQLEVQDPLKVARRAGAMRRSHPWPFTLVGYPGRLPGRTLVFDRGQKEAAPRQDHGVTKPGGIALTGASRRPDRRCGALAQ